MLSEPALRSELHSYLGGILANLNCSSLIVGGTADHVHLLHCFGRTSNIASLVKELKRGSSIWLKTKSPTLREFAWQSGYGVFSIGISEVEMIRKYIGNQEEHHRTISFQDELRELFHRHGIAYDERYIWE